MHTCKIILKKNEEQRLYSGHPWVYSNEIGAIEGNIKSGEIAYVYDDKRNFIGKGFLNTSSKIFVRLLTMKDEPIDEAFFYQRISKTNQFKRDLGYDSAYRAFFGEADGIPGLIVDKYGDYLSVQILSLGIDMRKDMFIRILADIFKPLGIYERSDVNVRLKEGLPLQTGVLYGHVPDVVHIYENQIKMTVDIKGGQKTGFYLDQQDNHNAIKPYVKDKSVLDCFSNIGGFGLHAAYYGAKKVICADISKDACMQIEAHAKLNGFDQVSTVEANIFDLLRDYQGKETFDTIILDPPAFAKSKDQMTKAYKGYKEINLQAMKLINDGGYLYTCSCTHFMHIDLFLEMLTEAAKDANKIASMVELRIQSKDHSARLGGDESLYLKCVILRITNK